MISVIAAALTPGTLAAAEAPPVVVSVKPIHSLVARVMEGAGTPRLLIDGAASPHTYSLRPADAAALQSAAVVFWVGEGLEGFLAKPLRALRAGRAVALSEAPGVQLLPVRAGGAWESHDHHADDHGHAHDDHAGEKGAAHEGDADEHGHAGHDMHLWLDPRNAQAMTRHIAAVLAQADPAHAELYGANAARQVERLTALEAELRAKLQPVRRVPYVVFHDAYHYFEDRFDLAPVGSITLDPDRKPGARRLYELRSRIVATGARCVFSEPQFEPALVRTVVEGTPARAAVLDPVGAGIPAGPGAYAGLLQALADSLAGCLAS